MPHCSKVQRLAVSCGALLLPVLLSGCIAVSRSSDATERLAVSTADRVQRLETRVGDLESAVAPSADGRLLQRIRQLEAQIARLEEENARLSEQISKEPGKAEE